MHILPVLPSRRICSIIKHRIIDHWRRFSGSGMLLRILEFLEVAWLKVAWLEVGIKGNNAGSAATISLVKVDVKISLHVEDSPNNAGLEEVRKMLKIAFSMQIQKEMASLIQSEESFHTGRFVVTSSNILIMI